MAATFGCTPKRPSVFADVPDLLAFVELETGGDRARRAAAARRSAPWGTPERPAANVVFAHELARAGLGAWTIARALREIAERFHAGSRWLFVAPPDRPVDVAALDELIRRHDAVETPFVGRALYDTAPSPIHHYAEPGFPYPDPTCGILLGRALVERLAARWATDPPAREMTIDAPYELARWIAADGTMLADAPALCDAASSMLPLRRMISAPEQWKSRLPRFDVARGSGLSLHGRRRSASSMPLDLNVYALIVSVHI